MSDDNIFVDTNILVYAYDIDAGQKHEKARQLVFDLWNADTFASISVQVLQELYATIIRRNGSQKAAREIVQDYLSWNIVDNTAALLMEGIHQKELWKISFWDALILAAAKQIKATMLWSEDFNHNQDYGGVIAVNPLISL